jgi:hypothetical protein
MPDEDRVGFVLFDLMCGADNILKNTDYFNQKQFAPLFRNVF